MRTTFTAPGIRCQGCASTIEQALRAVPGNAGSDVLADDPLSTLLLTPAEMEQRDLFVATQARGRGLPAALVLSGGCYGPHSWRAQARSLEAIVARFDGTPAGGEP